MFRPCDKSKHDWTGYTILVPSVSVGNVGQLCADLLIATLDMKKVGCFYDDSFMAVVGNDPFAHGDTSKTCDMMTAVEVYEDTAHKLVLVQQRALFVKGKRSQYMKKLCSWVKEQKFGRMLILTSSHAHERRDQQLIGSQFRFLLTPDLEEKEGTVLRENLKWIELEKKPKFPDMEHGENEMVTHMPGAGISKDLFEHSSEEGISTAVVLLFCSEGDNTMDALQLATHINTWQKWLDLEKKPTRDFRGQKILGGWKVPASWSSLFGNDPSPLIY